MRSEFEKLDWKRIVWEVPEKWYYYPPSPESLSALLVSSQTAFGLLLTAKE